MANTRGDSTVLTMHPTLLIGPADWDAARMPREEFGAINNDILSQN